MKSTPLSVQNAFNDKLKSSQAETDAVKAAHRFAAQAIKDDTTLSDTGKRQRLDALNFDTKSRIDALKESQESFKNDLRAKVEKELRGDLPTDAASVVSRRDAADRVRRLDPTDALEVLRDAIAGNDADLAHAIGVKARNSGWVDVAEEWSAAHPDTAGSAEALAYLDENGSGAGYNLFNSMTFNAPQD